MTTRPKSHSLSEKSVRRFQEALPQGWAWNEIRPDYGIDGRVEVFQDEKATGRYFFVQIKASKKKRRMCLKKAHIKYYMEMNTPVLLVQYIEQEDALYMKWASEVNLSLLMKEISLQKEQASFSFHFEKKDKLNENSWKNLDRHLISLREISQLSFPLNFYIRDFDLTSDLPDLKSEVIRNFSDLERFLIKSPSEEKSPIHVSIKKGVMDIIFLKKSQCSFQIVDRDPRYIKAILILGTSFCLSRIGGLHLAKEIFFENKDYFKDYIDKNKEVVLKILSSLFRIFKKETLQFIAEFCVNQSFPIPSFNCMLLEAEGLDNERELILKKIINLFQKINYKKGLGSAYYNLGRFYGEQRLEKSLSYYEKALKSDPTYSKRSYYFSEKGGLFFEFGQYKESAKNYKTAIRLDSEKKIHNYALYADALLHSGEYYESYSTFEKYLKKCENKKIEIDLFWILKFTCVKELILNEFKIEKQENRDTKKAESCFKRFSSSIRNNENDLKTQQAIQYDALSPLALFNMGDVFNVKEDYFKSAMCYALAATTETWDVAAWSNALLLLFKAKKSSQLSTKCFLAIATYIVQLAYKYHSEDFVQYVYNNVSQQSHISKKNRKKFKSNLDNIFDQCRQSVEKKKTLNLIQLDGALRLEKEVR